MSVEQKYVINGITEDSPSGNIISLTIQEGSIISISNPDAKYLLGGIWRNGERGPVIIFQRLGSTFSLMAKRSTFSIKGKATLKVNCYRIDWSAYQINVPITII